MESFAQFAWIAWVVLVLVFVTIEMLTLELTFLMVGIGSIGGLVAALLGAEWWLQIITAAIIAVLLLATIRPPLLRLLKRGGDPTRSNIDAMLGISGQVVAPVDSHTGQVRLANGETWTARLSTLTEERIVATGERVTVTAIDGATAVVVPAERSAL